MAFSVGGTLTTLVQRCVTASVQTFAALCGCCCEALQGEHHLEVPRSRQQQGAERGRRGARRSCEGNGFDVWFGIARNKFPQMLLRGQVLRAGVSELLNEGTRSTDHLA